MGLKLGLLDRKEKTWTVLILMTICGCAFFYVWLHHHNVRDIEAMSWAVAGRVFVVDAGHGGEDPGKVSPSGIYEKDINLAVAKKLQAILTQGGGRVIMTRDDDISLSDGQDTVRGRKRADLEKRIEIAEKSGADVYVAIHCNSFPSGRWSGAQTFYAPAVSGSKELAGYIQEELTSYLGNTTRKPRPDNVSLIFKKAKMAVVNVEIGFLSNPREEELLQDAAYQDKVAWAVYAGIVRYLIEYGDQYSPAVKEISK